MSETAQESKLQNGFQAQPESESKVEEQQPEPEPEMETKPLEELKLELVVTDVDPKPKNDIGSSIQFNETAQPASPDKMYRPELRKDEGNRTFTMRELLSELKNDEDDAGSRHRFFFLSLNPHKLL